MFVVPIFCQFKVYLLFMKIETFAQGTPPLITYSCHNISFKL